MADEAGECAYLEPYREAVARFGTGFEATLWGSRDAQRLRFDVMIDLAGLQGCTIVDAGCGRGDFAARLLERSVGFARYLGLDALPELIEAARGRGLARCSFEVADVVAHPQVLREAGADYVCICGTLNTMDDATARRLVEDAFEAAACGVVFNFLSTRVNPRWSGRDIGPARRFDPLEWIALALGLSPRVAFTQAYLDGHDATIMVLRAEAAAS